MYSFEWDKHTYGYKLITKTGKFIASELRPVFAEELMLTGLASRLYFDPDERGPLLWAKLNTYIYNGEEIAKIQNVRHGKAMEIEWRGSMALEGQTSKPLKLTPVKIDAMLSKNANIIGALVADTLRRIKEMYDAYEKKGDIVYIGFSGGKDSIVLLDLCHKVLPLDVPVVFSDTDMELPDTYVVWEKVKEQYSERPFIKVSSPTSALENWYTFGPPSQALRWCCSVHKSTPAILALKKRTQVDAVKTLAFVGVRSEESLRRSTYSDIGDGFKSQSQVNAMPILSWSAHELWSYIFEHKLIINDAYRKGLPRVGCVMCPMASDRQNELIRLNYANAVMPYAQAVRDVIAREFSTQEDLNAFIYDGGWYARKSGVSLKNVIFEPGVERNKNSILFKFPVLATPILRVWVKALRLIQDVTVDIGEQGLTGILYCVWKSEKIDKKIAKLLSFAVHKAMSCVGCGVCEAECPTGALKIKKKLHENHANVSIDCKQCIHCMKCYTPREGCWRYYSMRYAGATTMNISGINKYMTFGMKPDWIEVLGIEGTEFRQTSKLGNRMVPAAVAWFRESGLIEDTTTIVPTALLDVAKKNGYADFLLWQLLWVRLANISPLIKWYICHTQMNVTYDVKQLDELLSQSVSSESVRKGALQTLRQIVKFSPLSGDGHLIDVEMKGKNVDKITRRACAVDPLVLLYSLYVMAEKAGRGIFTVRQMMTVELEGEFVSPISIFGIAPDEFKKQCMGLASLYSDFVTCSFTLGLDEVLLYPEDKNSIDVVRLILKK